MTYMESDMSVFEDIKGEIMTDPMNEPYTREGIPPLFKASQNARIAIVGKRQGARPKKLVCSGTI